MRGTWTLPWVMRCKSKTQRGVGLMEVGLLATLLGAAVVGGYGWLRVQEVSVARAQSQALLTQADQRLLSFASVYHRLPCPDLDGDGWEDGGATGCTHTAQKGWLPFRTLGLNDLERAEGVRRLLYVVHRSSGVDLAAAATDQWRAIQYKDTTDGYTRTPGRQFSTPNIGTPDFCEGVRRLGALALDTSVQPYVAATPPRRLAYGLIHPAQAPGSGGFEDTHASTASLAVQPPQRTALPGVYNDEVRVRSPAQLETALDCVRLSAGIDQVSLGAEVVEEVNEQKVTNTWIASVLTGISGVKAVIAGVKTIKAGLQLGTAVGYMATATAELSAATAGCAVIVGCAALPHAIASVAAATVSIAASSAAVSATGTSMYASIAAGVLTGAAAIMAGASIPAGFDLTAAKAQADQALVDAQNAKNQAQTKYNEATLSELGLLVSKNSASDGLYNATRNAIAAANAKAVNPDWSWSIYHLDGQVSDTLNKANAWMNAAKNKAAAQEAYDKARRLTGGGSTDYSATLALIDGAIAAETDPDKKAQMQAARAAIVNGIANASNNAQQVAQIDAQMVTVQGRIDALNSQILSEANPDVRNRLINERDTLQRQKNELYTQKLNLTSDVAAALVNLNQASTDEATARLAFESSVTTLRNSVSGIPYRVEVCTTTGSGSSAVTTCARETRYHNAYAGVNTAILTLYENNSTSVQWDGVYFRWWLAHEATAARLDVLNRAIDAESQARAARDNIAALANQSGSADPPPVVWDGWKPVLQRADQKGGTR